jgi:hypothetical protein
MTKKELGKVSDVIETEGFEYGFLEYSDFEEVKDTAFHEKRLAFIKAYNELKEYLESQGMEFGY